MKKPKAAKIKMNKIIVILFFFLAFFESEYILLQHYIRYSHLISEMFEEFQGLGLKVLNVSIFTDSLNQIFELYEFNNPLEFFIKINRNWNIIYISIAIAVIVLGYTGFRISKRIINKRMKSQAHFDVILSDIEV